MTSTIAIDARLMSSANTGDTSYWRGLIRGLMSVESEFKFLLYSNTSKPEDVPNHPQFEWIHLPGGSRLWSLWTFPRAAARAGASLVHTQYNISPLVKNGLTTVHDVSFFVGPEWFQPRDRFLLQTQVPKSCARAKAVIAVSETTKREIEQYIPAAKGKISVTYNALGENIRPMSHERAREIVNGMGIVGRYVLTVGTRWPRKNMSLAVAAVDGLPDSLDCQLVITGKSGWGSQELGQRGRAVGYVSDEQLTALYQCAAVYLAPSFHEGFGIPVLEAFACGCPVICSPGGALPEVAQDAAIVMPNFEADDWALALGELLDDPVKRDQLRQKGTERLKDFSWTETAKRTLEVYRRALS